MIRYFLALSFLICISCKSDKATESAYSPVFNDAINIDATPKSMDGYSQLLVRALDLDSIRSQKLTTIIHAFEIKRTGLAKGGRRVKILTQEREEELNALLTPTELEQLRFVKLRYNNFPLKNPKQVTNIQKTVGMSDGQVLKYIEIVERFKKDGKKPQMNQRLQELLGDKYHDLLKAGTFYK